jgi:hypothetical protein
MAARHSWFQPIDMNNVVYVRPTYTFKSQSELEAEAAAAKQTSVTVAEAPPPVDLDTLLTAAANFASFLARTVRANASGSLAQRAPFGFAGMGARSTLFPSPAGALLFFFYCFLLLRFIGELFLIELSRLGAPVIIACPVFWTN